LAGGATHLALKRFQHFPSGANAVVSGSRYVRGLSSGQNLPIPGLLCGRKWYALRYRHPSHRRAHQRAHQRAHHFPKDVRYIRNARTPSCQLRTSFCLVAHTILPGGASHFGFRM